MSRSESLPFPLRLEKIPSNRLVSVSNMKFYRLWPMTLQVDTVFVWAADIQLLERR